MQWSPIITKFSDGIRRLELVETRCPKVSQFVKILSMVPNLEHLVVNCEFKPKSEQEPDQTVETVPASEELNLHKLKKLEARICNVELFAVFCRLPEDVLIELSIHFSGPIDFLSFLQRQKSVKRLRFSIDNSHQVGKIVVWGMRELETFIIESATHVNTIRSFSQELMKASKLKYLKITKLVDSDIAGILPDIAQLETLTLDVSQFFPSDFHFFSKMPCLKTLTLQGYANPAQLVELAKSNNSKLTTLNLDTNSVPVSVQIIYDLAKSTPNLKVISVNCSRSSGFDSLLLKQIMRAFNFVEVCRFNHVGPKKNITSESIFTRSVNSNLTEFSMTMNLPHDKLIQFVFNYPNLRKLYMGTSVPLTVNDFRILLLCLEKLQSLTLTKGARKLTSKDLTGMPARCAETLKFLALRDSTIRVTDSFRKKMEINFGVCVKNGAGLILAVDSRTMNTELLANDRNNAVFQNELNLKLL